MAAAASSSSSSSSYISPPPPPNFLLLSSSSSRRSRAGLTVVENCVLNGASQALPFSARAWRWRSSKSKTRSCCSTSTAIVSFAVAPHITRGSKKLIVLALGTPLSAAVTERTIALPIDYYQILAVDAHILADAVVRAYESRAKNPPEEGFSKDALLARQEILTGACETLADPDLRMEYNDSLAQDEVETIMVDVPFSKVPGVLCLLQEVGEMDIVLQVGKSLLQERLTKTYRRDIILSMALAYVELSRESMADSPPAIMQSCEMLERSLKLLQEEGGNNFAHALQEEIDKTLEHLNPRYMLELLALPLDKEHEEDRELGIQGIKSALWAVGEGGAFAPIPGFTREEFMKEAFLRMKAAELVDLFIATPSNIPAESSEVYAVALAHVAQGFSRKEPHLIREADTLILELQHANADLRSNSGVTDQKLEFAFERGMCALLLGQIDDCCAWLGLGDPNSPYRDESIMGFVVQNSSMTEEGDFLPGLCKLLEYWLGEVIFTSFRDLNDMNVKLKDYFDDPGVLNYLKSLEKGKSPLAAAAAIVQLGVGAGAALDNVKTSALETLRKVFPLRRGHIGLTSSKDDVIVDGSHTGSSREQDAVLDENVVPMDTSSLKANRYYRDVNNNHWILGNTETSSSHWDTAIKIAGTSLLIGLFSVAGWKILSPGFGALKLRGTNPSTVRIADSPGILSSLLHKSRAVMNAYVAKEVVRDWQIAKAKALGREHDIDKLSEVLDGQMLQSWTERAQEVHQNGWYWEYELTDLTIESVNVSKDGKQAVVEAVLWEGASLFDEKSKYDATDTYHSSYTTRYELILDSEGRWKITSGSVVRC